MLRQQKNFSGGINQIADDTQLSDIEYRWLVNARQRLGGIEPNRKADEVTNAPEGVKQAVIAVGNILIVFVAGEAFWRRDGETDWIQIGDFLMDETADLLYPIAIPASTFHFVRKLDVSINQPLLVDYNFKLAGTPAGVLVQDGAHQPWIITFDEVTQSFIARVTKNYTEWSNTGQTANSREYVPIGKQMMYLNQKLYIVSPDGTYIMHSITGRPLDFMVNVDANGNKLPTEARGGAASVSFAFDFDEITCIAPINIPDSFIYATINNIRTITLDYDRTIFGEPTYRESSTRIEGSGVVNERSFLEQDGNYVFIDDNTVKRFNPVESLYVMAENTVFSLQLSKILNEVVQTNPVCIKFNDYMLFDIDTLWGRMCIVFDNLLNRWVSFDIIQGVGTIKAFTVVKAETENKLFCITERDKLFQLYSADEREVAILMTPSWVNEETKVQIKSQTVHLFFDAGPLLTGQVFVNEYVDGQLNVDKAMLDKVITAQYAGVNYPVAAPVIPSNKKKVTTMTFAFPNGYQGRKIAYCIKWNTDAKLVSYEALITDINAPVSTQQATTAVGT